MNEETAQIVMDNMKLVHKVCQKLQYPAARKGLSYDDIASIGKIGLIKAIEKFNPDYGFEFSTYAVPVIFREIQRELRDQNIGAKFSRSVKEMAREIYKAGLMEESAKVIAEKLNVSIQSVTNALNYVHGPLYLDEAIYVKEDSEELHLSDKKGKDDDDTQIFVEEFLTTLTERDRFIVESLMNDKTQKEIGNVLGISQVQVSRIQEKLRQKLQEYENEGEESVKNSNFQTRPELAKAKELLLTTDLSVDEIAKQTGANKSSVSVYASKLRKRDESKMDVKKNQNVQTETIEKAHLAIEHQPDVSYITIKIPVSPASIPANVQTLDVDRKKRLDIGFKLIQNAIAEAYSDMVELMGTTEVSEYLQNYVSRKLDEASA